MEMIKFLQWLFDISQWDGFTKRLCVYAILGFGGAYFSKYSILLMMTAMMIDFTLQLLVQRWDEFKNLGE